MSNSFPAAAPPVGIVMGSRNDWDTLKAAAAILKRLRIEYEAHVVSAHRTPGRMIEYASSASDRGLRVIIAGAGGAAHLPGMIASETLLPVIGVPVQSRALRGLDSLLSIVQMPGGVPVATMAIGVSGAKNAGLFAARLLALSDRTIHDRLQSWNFEMADAVLQSADLCDESTD